MHELFTDAKAGLVASPQLKDNGAATVAYVDTLGYAHATFLLLLGAIDIECDAKLTESDVSGSGYADITDAAITQLDGDDDDKMVAIEVSLTGRKRYLKPVITVGDGSAGAYLAAVVILTRGEQSPANAAAAGLAELVKV